MTATLEQIAGAALSSLETVKASYDMAWMALCREVPGDFVECGVFAGVQCAAMAMAIQKFYFAGRAHRTPYGGRRVHLFDSFAGIPAGGLHDINWTHPAGTSACSLEQVMQYMATWGIDEQLLVYHPGMFDVTVKPFDETQDGRDIKSIAVLRLDGDLYESTRVCIERLLPLVSPGGWVIVDDFALPGARKAVLESNLAGTPAYFQVQP